VLELVTMTDGFWRPRQLKSTWRMLNSVARLVMLINGTDRVSDRCHFQRQPLPRTSEWYTAKLLGLPFPF